MSHVDVFDRVLAFPVQVGDALADVFRLAVFLAVELIPTKTIGVFCRIPPVGKIYCLYDAVNDGQSMGGQGYPPDVDLPVLAGHLI